MVFSDLEEHGLKIKWISTEGDRPTIKELVELMDLVNESS